MKTVKKKKKRTPKTLHIPLQQFAETIITESDIALQL